MEFPSLGEYWDALQLDPGIVLADPLLGRATVSMRAPGRPVVYGGTVAYTFKLATDTREYALRCFRREFEALQTRYQAIQAHLRLARSPHFANLQFQPAGITTETGDYPVARLDWIHGQGLASFVAGHLGDAAALQRLRLELRRLARHLHASGVAHGDIQPSNIIVEADGNLRLIDYDGMFVPALASLTSVELGQRHFQHPGRRPQHFDANLDAFSFALVDVALHALCVHPQLWDHTASGQDAFLFRATDIGGPTQSALFARLGQDATLARRVRDLASVCVAPFEQVPAFEDFLAGRNIPEARVARGGSPGRATYVPVSPVLDASDFSQCCKHVGERVELVGRVLNVARSATNDAGGVCVNLEFDVRPRDLVCISIWPEALADAGAGPGHDWAGQWVSAVGLIEPVAGNGSNAEHRKFVALSVTELCQVRRLPEAEACERLRAANGSGEHTAGRAGAVGTDPVVHASPTTTDAVVSGPASPSPDAPVPAVQPRPAPAARDRKRWWAAAVAAAAALATLLTVLVTFDRRPATTVETEVRDAGTDAAPVPRPKARVVPSPTVTSKVVLESQRALKPTDGRIETVAGTLRIAEGEGGCRHVIRLDDELVEGTCDDELVLVHHAVYRDHDVVVGLRKCAQDSAACRWRKPFWLELHRGAAPTLRQQPGLWVGSGSIEAEASDSGVRVDLRRWNGEQRVATLTALGNLVVQREAISPSPLSRADCASVAKSLEDCAASGDCGSFATAARPIPASRWASLQRLYHESTGLDAETFRKLCLRSCELRLSPSVELVRQYACQGAPPGQWLADVPAAGLER